MAVYEKVPIEMYVKETGRRPIGTRWVDTNKGDLEKPKVRPRLVAQELATHKQPELFAATPPIEYIRYLVARCASSQWTGKRTIIIVKDAKKVYFFALATIMVFVGLPWEDKGPNNIEHEETNWERYWDDMSGQALDANLTRAARAEDI